MRKILLEITRHQSINGDKLDIDAEIKVAWASFMPIGKISFTNAQRAAPSFKDTKVTRADISISEFEQFVKMRLKTSKTKVNHTRAFIAIMTKHQQNGLVMTV